MKNNPTLEETIKTRLSEALKAAHGNRTIVAQELGVSVRTVRNWLKKYRLAKQYPARSGRQK